MNTETLITALTQLAAIPDWIMVAFALFVAGITQVIKLKFKSQKELGLLWSWVIAIILGTLLVLASNPTNIWIAIIGIITSSSLISLAGSGAYSQLKSLQKKNEEGIIPEPEDYILPQGEGFTRIEVPETPSIGIQE